MPPLPPAAHIFTATQTKRDQAGGSWLSGRLVDPAMPLAGQPLFHAPAAGWSSVPPISLLLAPASPRRTQVKFLLGSRGGCGGKAQGWCPRVAPSSSLAALACSNRSQPLSVPADSLCLRGPDLRNPWAAAARRPPHPPTNRAFLSGSVPSSAPPGRSRPGQGRSRFLPWLVEGCGRWAGAGTGAPGTVAHDRLFVSHWETLCRFERHWAPDPRALVLSLLLIR